MKNTNKMDELTNLLNEVEKDIDARLTGRNSRISMIEGAIEAAELEMKEAREEEAQAANDSQMKKYLAAQKKIVEANETIQLCKQRIDEIMRTPLMTPEEYKKRISDLDAALNAMNMEEGARLAEIIKSEMIPARDAANNAIARANELFNTMLRKLLLATEATSRYISLRHEYSDYSINGAVSDMVASPMYQRAVPQEETSEGTKYWG